MLQSVIGPIETGSSGKVLNAIASHYPWLIGGAADLSPSCRSTRRPLGHADTRNHALPQTHRQNCSCPTSARQRSSQNPHSARRTAVAQPTAISCLGAFLTPASARPNSLHIPASENLHKRRSRQLHSITSSAVASSLSGMVTPSAFAVLRLITSSNVVGCSIGKSPGFAPLKILSTYEAARRKSQWMLAP